MYTRTKHTPASLCRFLLQLFISPCHFEACSCLPVSHPPNSDFSFAPLLLHFMRLCLPSSFLAVFDSPSLSSLCALSRLSNISSCHCEQSEMQHSLLLAAFFLCSCCITVVGFYFLSPARNLTVTPNSLYSCFPLFIFRVDWTPVVIFFFRCSSRSSLSNQDSNRIALLFPLVKYTAWMDSSRMSSEKSIMWISHF